MLARSLLSVVPLYLDTWLVRTAGPLFSMHLASQLSRSMHDARSGMGAMINDHEHILIISSTMDLAVFC